MGRQTYFFGGLSITPRINMNDFSECDTLVKSDTWYHDNHWELSLGGGSLNPPDGEKAGEFSDGTFSLRGFMKWFASHGYRLNGVVHWKDDDYGESGAILVFDNTIISFQDRGTLYQSGCLRGSPPRRARP